MATLSALSTALARYTAAVRALLYERPESAQVADDADTLEGIDADTLIQEVSTQVTDHVGNTGNPHGVTLAQVGGITRDEVNSLVIDKVPLNVLSVSQFGDTTGDDLGITSQGWELTFTKPISSYLMGMLRFMPAQVIDLALIDSAPANKSFYVHLRAKNQGLHYEISTTPIPETSDTMFLGQVVTGPAGISDVQIDRVTRLGRHRVSSSPVGNAIPTTSGNTSAPAMLADEWFPPMSEVVVTEGLVHRWPLARTLEDVVGDAHGSMVTGSRSFSTEDGKSCFRFDGSNRIGIPAFAVLGANPWTFSTWYNLSGVGNDYTHLLTSSLGQGRFALKITGESLGRIPYSHSGSTGNVQGSDPVPVGIWTHLVFTFDGTTAAVYMDGVQQVSREAPFNVLETDFLIGGWNNENSRGCQRELLYYNRALTQEEIGALYQAG